MNTVYVSIGSNIDRERHITQALDALALHFGELVLSSIYESEAVGFDGDPFYNLVAKFETPLSVAELAPLLREIETQNGRLRGTVKFSARTLDIDILTFNDAVGEVDGVKLPRAEIEHNAFVLLPLAEIAPDALHPVTGASYRAMWAAYEKVQALWPVDFVWREQAISFAAQKD